MMECMKKLAPKHGMACLLAEKPFAGINGSGKHNNWSLGTDTGRNLLKPGKVPAENKQFLLSLAAVIKAVDDYQDLLRISAASAGNDYRLGGHEAPPAIVSMFLGEDLDSLVDAIVSGKEYLKRDKKYMSFGTASVPAIRKDNTDRNRTSPFAFTGNKFEFRMVGSSQNIALANTVLNTAVAKSFSEFADVLEAAEDFDTTVDKLIYETLCAHKRIIFSGNSYSAEWEAEAKERGLSNYKTAPEAYAHLDDEKNVSLFEQFGVMSRTELKSRREIYFANYRKIKNIEARTMLEMTMRDYIPAVSKYVGKLSGEVNALTAAYPAARVTESVAHIEKLSSLLEKTYVAYSRLDAAQRRATEIEATEEAAFFYKGEVSSAMEALREAVDSMETLCARECWPVPTYGDITFGI
jgi:glutamine synthetase